MHFRLQPQVPQLSRHALPISRNQESYAEQFEFHRLAEKMKYNVRVLLESGNIDTARQVISQLKQLIPEDEELKELERQAGNDFGQ